MKKVLYTIRRYFFNSFSTPMVNSFSPALHKVISFNPIKMRRIISLIFIFVVSANGVKAQIDIPIGTGTTGNSQYTYPCPIQDWYEGSRSQYLFTATELIMAGMGPGQIVGVKWNALSTNSAGTTAQFTIKLGATATTSLNVAGWEPNTITQWGPQDYTPALGINTFNFGGGGFFWDGSSNLIVETCDGDGVSSGISYTYNASFPWTTGLAFNASHTYRADNSGQLCGTANVANAGVATTRPDITLIWVPAQACSGDPDPGVANTSSAVVCSGSNFSLYLTGQTLASGLTYQWQSSASSSGPWSNVAGATTGAIQTSTTTETWYRCQLACPGTGSRTMSSTPVKVSVVTCYTMPVSGSFTTCNGIFFDPGGENDYGNYANHTVTFYPANAGDKVQLNFTSFNTENRWDGLMIYDGNSTSAPLIPSGLPQGASAVTAPANSWYGTNTPWNVAPSTSGIVRSSAVDGSLTLVFKSDASVTAPGWRAVISCYTPPPCTGTPVPGNTLNSAGADTVCVGIPITLSIENAATLAVFSGLSYQWQSSTDNVTWNNIVGATGPSYVPSAGTFYYRCRVICANGGTGYSTVRRITLNADCILMPTSGNWSTCSGTFFDLSLIHI